MEVFKLDKAISSANNMMIRRDQKLSSMDEEIFAHLSKIQDITQDIFLDLILGTALVVLEESLINMIMAL